MTSVLWAVAAVVVCSVALYVAHSIEPHWVAKDGRGFITTSEVVDAHGASIGRRREVRGTVFEDGTLVLGTRVLMRTRRTRYRMCSKSPEMSRGRQQYVLEPVPPDPAGDLVVLRIPTTSRLTARFDELAAADPADAADAPSAEEA